MEGDPKDLISSSLDVAAGALQSFLPTKQICEHVCGFHFYSHDMTRQVTAHHYCSHINEDFRQCVIYDSPEANARLIGVEYIISEKLFKALDPDEKKYWHSHNFEVKSGQLILPLPAALPAAVANAAEHKAMEKIVTTYGKTWHLWQVDRGDTLPLGLPNLMMGMTRSGQVDEALLAKRDQEFGVSTKDKAAQRSDIPEPVVEEGANAWEKTGSGLVLEMKEVPMKR